MISLIEITYTHNTVQKPLVWEMSQRFEIMFNIYRANVDSDLSGHLILEIEGSSKAVHSAVEYLEASGAQVKYLEADILINRGKCTACGACVDLCYTRALRIDDWQQLQLDPSRCIRCYRCIEACPEQAIERSRP